LDVKGKEKSRYLQLMAMENKPSRGNQWKHGRDVICQNGRDSLIDIKVLRKFNEREDW